MNICNSCNKKILKQNIAFDTCNKKTYHIECFDQIIEMKLSTNCQEFKYKLFKKGLYFKTLKINSNNNFKKLNFYKSKQNKYIENELKIITNLLIEL